MLRFLAEAAEILNTNALHLPLSSCGKYLITDPFFLKQKKHFIRTTRRRRSVTTPLCVLKIYICAALPHFKCN